MSRPLSDLRGEADPAPGVGKTKARGSWRTGDGHPGLFLQTRPPTAHLGRRRSLACSLPPSTKAEPPERGERIPGPNRCSSGAPGRALLLLLYYTAAFFYSLSTRLRRLVLYCHLGCDQDGGGSLSERDAPALSQAPPVRWRRGKWAPMAPGDDMAGAEKTVVEALDQPRFTPANLRSRLCAPPRPGAGIALQAW